MQLFNINTTNNQFKDLFKVKEGDIYIFKAVRIINLKDLYDWLIQVHSTLGSHKSARRLFDDLRRDNRGFSKKDVGQSRKWM